MTFNIVSAVKYLWRLDLKDDAMEDLEKARWYIDREIQRLALGAQGATRRNRTWKVLSTVTKTIACHKQ